ncbi:hypothetical protein EYC84_011397 [Monilinia fructicola]|uniref:CCHC-type domain-containing protein n=1 Tax=Monilinia fructicola TaxID=38448 RepID=A0A5M9J560_MONFR|nr:hypothetical protein EYC84_011397 [Monilinia fructicola]
MAKRRNKTSDSGDDAGHGRDNGSGGAGDKGNGKNNDKPPNKGRVPQEFVDCRICDGKFHWESDCRKNPLGVGKRNKDTPKCRACTGNHWEDQCRTWKSKNAGGNGNNNNNNNNNNSRPENPTPGKLLAPTGEDITHFFPNGKFPRRPCSKCQVLGHWNDACEKDGFDPVTNPNPGARKDNGKGKGGSSPDEKASEEVDSPFNEDQSPPDTPTPQQPQQPQQPRQPQQPQQPQGQHQGQQPQARQGIPPVNFGYTQKQTKYNPNYNYLPGDPRNPNLNTHGHRPEYLDPNASPFQRTASTGSLHPHHPSHPDSSYYRTTYRSQTCTFCQEPGHKSNDCKTFLWLLPRTNPHWRPHPDLQHPSNTLQPRPNGSWHGNPTTIPSANTYIWPHPRNTHQGIPWEENSYDFDGGGVKDIWLGQDDLEGAGDGRGLRWGAPPGGVGGGDQGGLCQFDGEGDVVMLDILDLEGRRGRQKRRREAEEERAKPWWMKGGGRGENFGLEE